MNTPHPAQRAIDIVASDSTVVQLRTRLVDFEHKLATTQNEITASLQELQRKLKSESPTTQPSDEELLSGDIDTMFRPPETIESLRELIRQRRMAEGELADSVRIVRTRLRQREDAAYESAFRAIVVPEQLKVAGQVIDNLLALAELWHKERSLRDPLYAVGRFERADIWASQPIDPGSIHERIERLAAYGYQPKSEQRRRLDALLKVPR